MKNNRQLISRLIAVMFILNMVDTGMAQITKTRLITKTEESALILKNSDGAEIMIQPGTVLSIDDQIMVYKSVDMVNRIVYLTKKKESIPLSNDEITSINVYLGTKASEWGQKGMLRGGLIGGAIGLLVGVGIASEYGKDQMFLYAPVFALIGGASTGLIGMVVGSTQKEYNTYELGSDKWEIANRSSDQK